MVNNKKKSEFLDKYQIYLYSLKINMKAIYWILLAFFISLFIGLLLYFVSIKLSILAFVLLLDLSIGLPVYFYYRNIEKIEQYWPDSLRLIADTLKAGSSFDYALRETANADFGLLSKEFHELVRRIDMGDTTQQALGYMSLKIESKIIRRTITLIQECLKTGAKLADVLDEIANDTKNMFRIKKERQTKTMLQVIFIFAAGGVIAPFIFGLITVISSFLIEVSTTTGIASESAIVVAVSVSKTIALLLNIYLVLEVLAASAMVSMMRESTFNKMYIYFPVMICIAFLIFTVSQYVVNLLLMGMI